MQYLTNFHSHCVFCDGRASMEAFVQYAIAKGLKAYGVSSHAPVPFVTRWAMHEEDLDEYLQEFTRLKQLYSSQIELYLGLELDYLQTEKDAVFKLHNDVQLDYRIGSIHYINTLTDGAHWNVDCETAFFHRAVDQVFDGSIKRCVTAFFDQTAEMIERCDFQIIGHVDKIVRNALTYSDFDLENKWFLDLVYETFSLIKQKDIIVEINTKSLKTKKITYPNKTFYGMLKGMHIPVMVNTDAHYPDLIMSGMQETYAELLRAGIKTVRVLNQGKWVDIPIE